MKITIPVFALFLLCGSCDEATVVPPATYACTLSQPSGEDSHPRAEEFRALLQTVIPYTTGVQVAVTDRNGDRWTGALGFADLANDVPLVACHQLMIASISKTVTASIILQLYDEGELDLDDQLSAWLEDELIGELANAREVSLRQLLNHTSGIPDYLTAEQFLLSQNRPFLLESQREKLRYAYGLRADNTPGAGFSYSNTNYVLLGLVVEKATGQALWEAVADRLVGPLNLQRFAMGTETDPIPDHVARPYLAFTGGKYIDFTPTAVADAATGDGGIISNMQDLTRWVEALFSGELIEPATLAEMIGAPVDVPTEQADFSEWPDEGYGLGITRYNTPWGTAYGHTGSTSSYNSFLFYFPESAVTLAAVTNGIDLELIDEFGDAATALRNDFLTRLHE
ncbi:MAG: serine hydrolase domain-containing protein [Bacteroidota bacterium]